MRHTNRTGNAEFSRRMVQLFARVDIMPNPEVKMETKPETTVLFFIMSMLFTAAGTTLYWGVGGKCQEIGILCCICAAVNMFAHAMVTDFTPKS